MKYTLLSLLLIFTYPYGQAQGQLLTLKDAIQFALQNNQNLKIAKLDIENTQYKISEVKAGALPNISASGGLTYNPLLQKSALPGDFFGKPGETILVAFGQEWNGNANLVLNQTLFSQSVFTGLKAASSSLEYYNQSALLTEEQIIENVANNYYQVLIHWHNIAVLDSTIQNTQQVSRIINGQFESGLAKQLDVDRIAVTISNLQAQRTQLVNTMTIQENILKYAMGLSMDTKLSFPPIDFSSIKTDILFGEQPNVNNMLRMSVLKQQGKLLQYQKEAYIAENYPTLSLTANYGYQGLGNSFPIPGKDGVNWFGYSSIGLNLKVPIFNGFATKARVNQAEIQIRKNQYSMELTNQALNMEFENARSQIGNNLLVLQTQKDNVALAQKVYNNSKSNYNLGLASLTDLLDAEKSLTASNNNYSSALLNYKIAEIQMLKSQGKLTSLLN